MRSVFGFFIGLGIWLMGRGALLFLGSPGSSQGGQKGPARQGDEKRSGFRLLITGRVDSKNWCRAHLLPLARTANISELLLVVDGKVSSVPKTRDCPVPETIGWFRPRAIIRSIWVIAVARREKPDMVMAYSFFPPGLFGLLAARLSGAAAILQLPGGPAEIESGGWVNDDLAIPVFLRRRLIGVCQTICSHFDAVIVRGRKGETYVQQHSHPALLRIVPGSIDASRYRQNGLPRSIDIVFVGRVVPIKQPDHICQVVRRVAQRHPSLRVVVAGNGQSLAGMKEQARKMGLADTIRFIGHVERVEGLLVRSRVFLLTSKSEGLSIALAEAMTAGAVPVVANVGDLSELVINGKTGWLIPPGDFDAYAERICNLLDDQQAWSSLSANARRLALANNGIEAVASRWEDLFDLTMARRQPASQNSILHEALAIAPASRPEGPPKRRPSAGEKTTETVMTQEPIPDPSPERPPNAASGRNPTTDFFSAWEDFGGQYERNAAFRDRLDLFIQSVRRTTPPPAKVLDFGCGAGNIAVKLVTLGYDVLGLDGASGMIDVSRARAARIQGEGWRFQQVASESFDPSIGPFDAVVCSSVLEYVEDDLGLLKRLVASLRPGGRLFVSVPHRANVFAPLEPVAHMIKLRLAGKTQGHLAHTLHHYSRPAFSRQLHGLGLEDLCCTSFECPILGGLGIKLSRWSVIGRMLLFEGRKGPASQPAASADLSKRRPESSQKTASIG